MQPSSAMTSSSSRTHSLTQEHRKRLYSLICELDNEQLHNFLSNHVQKSSLVNQFGPNAREQLIHQSFLLFDNFYSMELEQKLRSLVQKKHSNELFPRFPQPYFIPQQPEQYNARPNYRFTTPTAVMQQLRPIRPNPISSSQINLRSQQPQQQSRSASLYSIPDHIPHSTVPPLQSGARRHQAPLTTPIPSKTYPTLRPPITKIAYKNLPFYYVLGCVHERYNIFIYDAYRKQFTSRDQFILPLEVCNQLALSYDYDPVLDCNKTSKCLLLRLARLDQPPTFNGKYEDSLPVNVVIQVNGHVLTNLPAPKPCTRLQKDYVRVGREIDITPHCMFNPILKNDITILWTYPADNKNLAPQYKDAEYALHVFLAECLTMESLCEHVLRKPMKFNREDLIKLLSKASAHDRDLGLEVSDQKLKLICPIDQKRLKKPVRATTCQHLQCFDLTNYISLNEKSNKWMCPVCNKPALYEDLQIDCYMDSILQSIQNHDISEISIDSELCWLPIIPSSSLIEQTDTKSNTKPFSSSTDVICIDDD
ncbi:unnamed protein product [Adineta ricciae]|uniref:Uncharacterized protein n=1 Tax=Adineta ricciae TaxID=249248 RepID=A0A813RV32_ADIRI|nr:unnamed protein product [Adineta ricciae]CAF1567629.1 unnamed protein product [Adineta ricciae]